MPRFRRGKVLASRRELEPEHVFQPGSACSSGSVVWLMWHGARLSMYSALMPAEVQIQHLASPCWCCMLTREHVLNATWFVQARESTLPAVVSCCWCSRGRPPISALTPRSPPPPVRYCTQRRMQSVLARDRQHEPSNAHVASSIPNAETTVP
jgi:hypothetical protein